VTGKDAIASILKAEGTDALFCFPDSRLVDACAVEGIRPIIGRSERVVINMADGFSRVAGGGRIGVCAVQEGAGIENAFSGVAQAFGDSVPLLLIPGQAGRDRVSVPPEFDAVSNYRGVTKWAAQANLPDRIPALMRRAFTALRTGRPGPVLLELPTDVADAPLAEEYDYEPVTGHRSGPDPADVDRALDLLLRARRPVVLAGQGIHRSGAYEELRQFAELLRLPVATTMGGKSTLPEHHPLALGVGAVSATAMVARFLEQADLVLALGTSLTRWWMSPPLGSGRPIIQCCLDERDLNKDYPVEHVVLGDARVVLAAMHSAASERLEAGVAPSWDDPAPEIAAVKAEWLAAWEPKLTSDETPLNPYRVIHDLASLVDLENTIVTHDSGSPREQLSAFWEARTPGGYVGWGHSTQLGYSLGLAMGMKLARPSATVVNVMGDGAFGMVGVDVETASRYGIGILTVLLNNSALGNYERYMPEAVNRYSAKSLAGNYADVASALGAWSERVTVPGEIIPALRRALAETASGRPALVEMITREEPELSTFW
jgi:acetolactate synthase-1/2/3 large subunit